MPQAKVIYESLFHSWVWYFNAKWKFPEKVVSVVSEQGVPEGQKNYAEMHFDHILMK